MADTTTGLFGMTPESYQLAQDQAAQAQALQFAKLDPFEKASYGMALAGNRLGGALGQALGAQDPMLQQVSMQQSILKNVNPGDPTSLAQGIQAAQQAGLPQIAVALAGKLQELQKNQAEIAKSYREGMSTEQKNAQALADQEAARGTPEWTAAYKTQLERLTAGTKGANIKEIGVAEGSRQPVYFDVTNDTQFIMQQDPATGKQVRVPFNGGVDRTTSKTELSLGDKGAESFVKRLSEKDADKVIKAIDQRDASIASLKTLNRLATLDNQGLISGSFANGRVGVTNLLSTLGLASPADAAALSNSQNYQKAAGDLVLATLDGKLGAGFSNDDREFIKGLVPQLETSPEARRELIKFMRTKNQDIIKEATKMETYARKNKSLGGYEPTIPLAVPLTTNKPLSEMTLEELQALRKNVK